MGLQLNFFTASHDDYEYGSGNGTYIEAASGYFKPTPDKHWVFESYAGIGTGSVINKYEKFESSKVGITKLFIQPSFGYSSKYFEMAVSSKFSNVNFHVKSSTVNSDSYEFENIKFLRSKKSFFLWEPGIMIRGGFKNLKFLAQLTHSISNDLKPIIDDTNFSLGIMIPFKIKKKS
jgi:hypothetical protein